MRNVPYPELPEEEFLIRQEVLVGWLNEAGLNGLVLLSDENITYYSGFRRTFESPMDWLQALVISADGSTGFMSPSQNVNIVERSTYVDEVRWWGGPDRPADSQDPIRPTVELAKDLCGGAGRIGAELGPGMIWQATPPEIDGIRSGLGQHFDVLDASPWIWEQRSRKTTWEKDVYRSLGRVVTDSFKAGLRTVREGTTEREILRVMWETAISGGAYDTPMQGSFMIRSGQGRYDMFCARPIDRALQPGDQIMIDSGPTLHGYFSDIQRQACVGEPEQLQRKLFDRGRAGFEAALSAIHNEATVKSVYEAATGAMAGFEGGPTHAHIRFMGHGIGLANHEPPWLTDDSDGVLRTDMVLSIEIPSYDVPEYRVIGGFLEDMVIVTETGYEPLTDGVPHDLWIA